jgi:hypothetical protein
MRLALAEAGGKSGGMTEPGRTDTEIRPFRIDIPQPDLDNLHDRLLGKWPPDLYTEPRKPGMLLAQR